MFDYPDYLLGSSRTYADLVLFAHLNAIHTIEPDCLVPFPLLKAHYSRIATRPKIQAYINKRPQSGL
jgi:glutathione S-transferase